MPSMTNEMNAKLGDVYPITKSPPPLMKMLQGRLLSGPGLDHDLSSIITSSTNKNDPQDIESLFKANSILPQLTATIPGLDGTITLTHNTSPTTDLLQNNHLNFDVTKRDGQHSELSDNHLFKRDEQQPDERKRTTSDNTNTPSTLPSSSESPINENNVLAPTSQIKTENILSTLDALTKSNIVKETNNIVFNNTKNDDDDISPLMSTAGRKKTHPVWRFFRDVKDKNEEGGASVICLNCTWKGDDKSPNNLKTHLKRVHANDGVYEEFTKALAETPTHPYVKRKRAGVFNNTSVHLNGTSTSSPQMLNDVPANITLDGINFLSMFEMLAGKTISEHEALLKESYSIKPDIGEPARKKVKAERPNAFDLGGDLGELDLESLSNLKFGGANLASNQGDNVPLGSLSSLLLGCGVNIGNNQNNDIQSLLDALGGGNQLAVQPTPVTSIPQIVPQQTHHQDFAPFSLGDGVCMRYLMGIAKDMDVLIAYRSANTGDEFTFSKHYSGRADYTNNRVVLFETREEIKTCVRIGDNVSEVESWKKTNPSQLQWALRGKVQSALF